MIQLVPDYNDLSDCHNFVYKTSHYYTNEHMGCYVFALSDDDFGVENKQILSHHVQVMNNFMIDSYYPTCKEVRHAEYCNYYIDSCVPQINHVGVPSKMVGFYIRRNLYNGWFNECSSYNGMSFDKPTQKFGLVGRVSVALPLIKHVIDLYQKNKMIPRIRMQTTLNTKTDIISLEKKFKNGTKSFSVTSVLFPQICKPIDRNLTLCLLLSTKLVYLQIL